MAVQAPAPGMVTPAATEAFASAERAHELVALHARLHELIGRDAPLIEVLEELVAGIERYEPTVMPCVVLLDRESSTLHPGAGPSLPAAWLAAIDGVVIGPNTGSCGAAAWLGKAVITPDIALDPKWEPVREFAGGCGLRHCWSMPIIDADGGVLGTFALYGREPRRPAPEHLELMRDGARLAAIAIERRRTMERLIHDARHDALTGLPNRRAIFEELEAAVSRASSAAPLGVLFVDLDGLKSLNDSLGHDRADEMIREVGDRLRTAVRTGDFIGRFGGDEFVIIAERVVAGVAAKELAERVRESVAQPLTCISSTVVTASVGVALISDGKVEVAEAIRQADSAMYAAKRAGRDSWHFYEGSTPARASRRRQLAGALRDAAIRGEMRLVFQPVFDLASEAVTGVEALLRWRHPELGEIEPAELIPVAEESNAIVPLGAWVLRESCEELRRFSALVGRELELSVNVSGRQLGHRGFARSVCQTLAHAGLPARLLTLEVTEAALINPDPITIRQLRELEQEGIGLVLDDFGSGYSSLSLLRQQPLSGIKLDREFVAGILADSVSAAIFSGIIELARGMGLTVTAEGVETTAQQDALRSLGCDRAQGFLLARPMTLDELAGRSLFGDSPQSPLS